MRLRTRLVLMVAVSVSVGILAVSGVLSALAWRSILAQAESEGLVIARLLAQGATVSEQVVAEVGSLLEGEMMSNGVVAAHLADLADAERMSDADLGRRLAEIVARTPIDELWISDAAGRVRAGSSADIDAGETLAEVAGLPPAALAPLLNGSTFWRTLGVGRRPLGGAPMFYVGVRGSDTPRVVLVGREQKHIENLARTLGVPRLLETLLRDETVQAVWVFDSTARPVSSRLSPSQQARRPDLSARERAAVQAALSGEPSIAILADGSISVAAAMQDSYGTPAGATLARLSSAPLDALILDYARIGGSVALVVLLGGVLLSVVMGRRIAAPMVRIASAAADVDHHDYVLGSLDKLGRRRDELGHLARTFETMARQVQAREEELEAQVRARTAELMQKNAELDAAKRRLEADLELARLLQSTILPQAFPADRGWAGFARMTPALQMAGDFYDYFAVDACRMALIIADVSGKGVAPAFFMAVSRSALREAARAHEDPGACLAAANDRLCDQNPLDMFVTVFLAVIDEKDGSVVYCNGGHNPPYIVGPDGSVRQVPGTGDMALGVMAGMDYGTARVQLAPGETLFLYTDGVTEAMDPVNEEFGEKRLEAVLAATAGQPVQQILDGVTDAVRGFAASAPQSDDITCLVVRFAGGRILCAP